MSMRFVSIAGVCLAVLTLALSGCEKKTESPPVKIGAIFAVTGPASFPGVPEAKTAEMLVERINQSGGVNGRQLLLVMKDSGSKPDNAISLAQQLIDEEKVLAIIGSSTSGETLAIKNICQEAKTILISCAAAEDIVNPIASNDGYGMAGKAQLEKLAPESGITLAISETYDKQETDLTGVLTKLKGVIATDGIFNFSPQDHSGLTIDAFEMLTVKDGKFAIHKD